jgi:hypothetical protein
VTGVSEPDECRFEGVPSNRGISSGVTTSTTIASGGGAWKAFAPTKNKPTIRAARWPMTETASPLANVSLQSHHNAASNPGQFIGARDRKNIAVQPLLGSLDPWP